MTTPPETDTSFDRALAPQLATTIILAVIGLLAFTTPWVRVDEDGETLASSTLSGRWTELQSGFTAVGSSPMWAIVLVVLLVVLAVIVWRRPTAHAAASAAAIGGFVTLLVLLSTWLGRTIWLNIGELPASMSLQMEWGYDLALVLSVILMAVSSYLVPSKV